VKIKSKTKSRYWMSFRKFYTPLIDQQNCACHCLSIGASTEIPNKIIQLSSTCCALTHNFYVPKQILNLKWCTARFNGASTINPMFSKFSHDIEVEFKLRYLYLTMPKLWLSQPFKSFWFLLNSQYKTKC